MPGDGMKIVLRGNWQTGGLLEFLVGGELVASIRFAPAPWSVLANLMLAAIRSQCLHWFDSYVPAKKLADSLVEHEVLQDREPEKIHKQVHNIRNALAESGIPELLGDAELTGRRWADSLIKSNRGPGYRITLPPKSLRLFIGETEYGSDGQQSAE